MNPTSRILTRAAPLRSMGFANWNTFACDYNDTVIRQTADALVSSGLARAGYDVSAVPRAARRSPPAAVACR